MYIKNTNFLFFLHFNKKILHIYFTNNKSTLTFSLPFVFCPCHLGTHTRIPPSIVRFQFRPLPIKESHLLHFYPPCKQHTKLKPSSTSNSLFYINMLCPLTTAFSSYYNVLNTKTRPFDIPSLNFSFFNDISIVSPSFRAGVLAFHGTWYFYLLLDCVTLQHCN